MFQKVSACPITVLYIHDGSLENNVVEVWLYRRLSHRHTVLKFWGTGNHSIGEYHPAGYEYFKRWYLSINESKTVSCVFHIHNRQVERRLDVTASGILLPSDPSPMYQGIKLDLSLIYRQHQEGSSQKLEPRVSLIRKLTNTNWRPSSSVLRVSALSLFFCVAENGCPVWCRSAHTRKIDIQLFEVMRLISETIRSTPLNWLQCMRNIEPPAVRRQSANQRMHTKVSTLHPNSLLRQVIGGAPRELQLQFRRLFFGSKLEGYDTLDHWRSMWEEDVPQGGLIIFGPTHRLPGFSETIGSSG